MKTSHFFTFNIVICGEIESDINFLYERLIHSNRKVNFEYYGLAKHLLYRLQDPLCIKDEEWDDSKLS